MSKVFKNHVAWTDARLAIDHFCALPHMTSSRLLRILERDVILQFSGSKNEGNRIAADAYNWRRYSTGEALYRMVPMSGRYAAIPSHLINELIVPLLADVVSEKTDAVVELGSGYGRNLFALRDVIEHEYPNIRYFGGEIAKNGREAGRRVAALEPGRAGITFHDFDYLNPDLSFLAGCRNIVFFTCHSIEQVYEISPDLILAMRDAGTHVRCIHMEPVGWQLVPEIAKAEADGTYVPLPSKSIAIGNEVDDYYAARMPIGLKWNRNLTGVLKTLADNGEINLELIERNACGNQIYNPSTLIYWSRP